MLEQFGIDETIKRIVKEAWGSGTRLTVGELAEKARYSAVSVKWRLKAVAEELAADGICVSTAGDRGGKTTLNIGSPPCPGTTRKRAEARPQKL